MTSADVPVDGRRPIRRALVSVYDKTGLPDLAAALHAAGVEIVSTGGSAAAIAGLGIPVTAVDDLTGFPECLEGRVKTLHPAVHAGLLADTRKPDHVAQLADLGVEPFDLVVVNLYPFADTVASGAGPEECLELIDIGGPAMVRAAAKNHASVAVVVEPASYGHVGTALSRGGFTLATRKVLAAKAFAHTAAYDVAVATWLADTYLPGEADVAAERAGSGRCRSAKRTGEAPAFPDFAGATFTLARPLRYGENPHQRGALYRADDASSGIAQGEQRHGKEMSYNNYTDGDAAYRAAHDHGDVPTVAIVKHANPCGIAVGAPGEPIEAVHARAHACDPLSAFGGIIATNRPVTAELAEAIKDIFTEVVIAPEFAPAALAVLEAKKNLRLLQVPPPRRGGRETRPVSGGLLVQDVDLVDAVVPAREDDAPTAGHGDEFAAWTLVAGPAADDDTRADLQFAWRAVRSVKSNAILLAAGRASVGIGMGQVNRVDSCQLAVRRAGADRARGAVAASDAFFPFADGPEILIDAGVRAIVAPGGSIRDADTIAACDAAGVSLYFTGVRHFAH